MSQQTHRRVAIIGGGLSGLASAVLLHLAEPAFDITLFEAKDHLGGVIDTETADGFVIDHGADMFATNPPAALDLCRRLGIEDQLIEPEPCGRGARIVHRGRLVPIPEGFVLMRATKWWPMMTTPLLSPLGKLRFFAERWIRSPENLADETFDESVESFVRRRMGGEVLDRIVAPLSAGIYTADITKLSMRATMGPIADMERQFGSLAKATAARRRSGEDSVERSSTGARYGQFRSFRGGMVKLIENLAATLPATAIRTQTPIRCMAPATDKWTLITESNESQSFDHVIVATPPHRAANLLADFAPTAADELRGIESASTAIVILGVARKDIANDINTFGFVVPASENRQILAGSFASHKFAGRAPEGHVLIRVFIGGAMQHNLLQNSDHQLLEIARRELADLIGLGGEPVISRVVRWNQAMPQYHVGHRERVRRIEAAVEKIPGLTLINNGLNGVGIAPIIQAADRVANQLCRVDR